MEDTEKIQNKESGLTICDIPRSIGESKMSVAEKSAVHSFPVSFLIIQKKNNEKNPEIRSIGSLKLKFILSVFSGSNIFTDPFFSS